MCEERDSSETSCESKERSEHGERKYDDEIDVQSKT